MSACSEGTHAASLVVTLTEDVMLALKDDPHYVKALQRRAGANEKLGSWTSLTSAQEGGYQTHFPAIR